MLKNRDCFASFSLNLRLYLLCLVFVYVLLDSQIVNKNHARDEVSRDQHQGCGAAADKTGAASLRNAKKQPESRLKHLCRGP